ncbi:hypothetical protein VPHK359_0093 [Vibrio phage K359]
MKTFETEKHNIPKGATHYWNEAYDGNKIVSDMYDNFGFRFKLEEK